jgi:hypothetical protein
MARVAAIREPGGPGDVEGLVSGGGRVDIRSAQQMAWANKLAKG